VLDIIRVISSLAQQALGQTTWLKSRPGFKIGSK